MPRGDKSKYTDKQDRKAEHIEESYESRGVPRPEAEHRAWATVNKDDGGGKASGSGRGVKTGHSAAHRGGGPGAATARPASKGSTSAEKATATSEKNS
jgi:plasmid stabilization system protein ParE